MPNQIQTTKYRIPGLPGKIGVWLYAKEIIATFFYRSFQTKHNLSKLVAWLRGENRGQINSQDEFIPNQEITVPADGQSVGIIIGQEIGRVTAAGTITIAEAEERDLGSKNIILEKQIRIQSILLRGVK